MGAAAFDTLENVKRLTDAGTPEARAEALADEQLRLVDDRLATKDDVAEPRAATAAERVAVASAPPAESAIAGDDLAVAWRRLAATIDNAKFEIITWIFIQTLAYVAVLVAAVHYGH